MWSLLTENRKVCIATEGEAHVEVQSPIALLPGSFNPLHCGHTGLADAAARRLGVAVHYELSIANVDKPELPRAEAARRLEQFAGLAPVWLTLAATFEEKADHFPGAAFVVGWDTAIRLIDPRYYGSEFARDEALRKLRELGCRVVVGGRLDARGIFRVWEGVGVASEFADLFITLSEEDFRVDVSSSILRGDGKTIASGAA